VIKQLEGILVVSGKLLIVAKLRVLKALAHWQLGEQKQAKSAMIQGLALLGEQPFRRFVLDEGETAQSLVRFILQETSETLQFSRVTRKRLQELSFNWSRGEPAFDHSSSRTNLPLHKTSKSQQQCCLELLEQGFSNHEIANTMGISINTVKYHLKNLYRIMGVNNRTAAVRLLCSENNQEALLI
jgi:ATP/maltotriose-dependent transcriptional regulator MalT